MVSFYLFDIDLCSLQAVSKQKKGDVRRVHVGFPFLFVCMVALISLALGYLMRS